MVDSLNSVLLSGDWAQSRTVAGSRSAAAAEELAPLIPQGYTEREIQLREWAFHHMMAERGAVTLGDVA